MIQLLTFQHLHHLIMSPSTETTTAFVELPKPAGLAELPHAPVYDITNWTDERAQTLKRLLDDGHAAVAPLRNPNLKFHTHLPHVG